ncbi:cardiolipin synthase ClsB [Lysobacter sp. HX-5-24]|uniref:Cardiolipin synthase B n=1 Tax=Noviluteimonas gilva TaxID=2682097 RepID=A0A7C9HNE5_9GAMM|nr:cardiolipin synthase ClsB [Lysobacter gilvus]MUV15016.1 cardiolipin synthase ClsB [Lysobacter gilvus]
MGWRRPRAPGPWRSGNRVQLLENGEEFFPRAFAAIAAAQREVIIETFILFEDPVGRDLQRALIQAANRGVRVDLTVDGYGSPDFSPEFLSELVAAGVRVHVFDPHPGWVGIRVNVFRRLHRKLLIVDGTRAFIGGINYSVDHLAETDPKGKQDYAVEIEGPVVADILSFARAALAGDGTGERWKHPATQESTQPSIGVVGGLSPPTTPQEEAGTAEVLFELRDNRRRRTSIEREYRRAIREAKREIIIANAYFFPGWGFLRELRRAARRGVRVTLLVAAESDTPIAHPATRTLYRHLLRAHVDIVEYCERPFHGKVALIDGTWATIGSSNLDPLSLALNLESNVFVRDAAFASQLQASLTELRQRQCHTVDAAYLGKRSWWTDLTRPLLFHVLQRFPRWAGLLPAHTPQLVRITAPADTP